VLDHRENKRRGTLLGQDFSRKLPSTMLKHKSDGQSGQVELTRSVVIFNFKQWIYLFASFKSSQHFSTVIIVPKQVFCASLHIPPRDVLNYSDGYWRKKTLAEERPEWRLNEPFMTKIKEDFLICGNSLERFGRHLAGWFISRIVRKTRQFSTIDGFCG
jgi:hypothetical protein